MQFLLFPRWRTFVACFISTDTVICLGIVRLDVVIYRINKRQFTFSRCCIWWPFFFLIRSLIWGFGILSHRRAKELINLNFELCWMKPSWSWLVLSWQVFEAKSIKDLKTVLKYKLIKSLSKNTILLEISDMSLVIIAFCLFLLTTKLGDKKF